QSPGSGSETSAKGDNVTIKSGEIKEGSVNAYFVVKKSSRIQKLAVAVYGSDNHIVDSKPSLTLIDVGNTSIVNASLKLASGKNVIRAIDADKPTEKANEALAEVTCAEKCSKAEAGEEGGAKAKSTSEI